MTDFEHHNVRPFEDAIGKLEAWKAGSGDGGFEDDGGEVEQPYVNPFRDVGRNDECPCGSGKKYKKCCLAA